MGAGAPAARRLVGVGLGLLVIVKILDMGFYAVLARPFDPVLDWILFDDALSFLTDSVGRAGAIGVRPVVLLVVAVLVLMTLSVLRLTRWWSGTGHRATRGLAALAAVWVACAVLGAQIVPGCRSPPGAPAAHAYDRAQQVHAGLHDQQVFAAQAAVDAFRDTPGDQLLTALRGKDVVFSFVESYGRDAVEDPEFAPQIGARARRRQRPAERGRVRLAAAPSSPRRRPAAAAGWPTPRSCPACGSTTSSATATSSPATG